MYRHLTNWWIFWRRMKVIINLSMANHQIKVKMTLPRVDPAILPDPEQVNFFLIFCFKKWWSICAKLTYEVGIAECNPNHATWTDGQITCQQYLDDGWCTPEGQMGLAWTRSGLTNSSFYEWPSSGFTALNCPQCGCYHVITGMLATNHRHVLMTIVS